jgi:hypothetical protein
MRARQAMPNFELPLTVEKIFETNLFSSIAPHPAARHILNP